MRVKTELMILGAVMTLGVVVGLRSRSVASGVYSAAGDAFSFVDGNLTNAVLSIPGMTLFQDSAGNFNPVNAGYEAGEATRQAVSNLFNGLSTTPPPAEGMGAAQTNFGGYVSM
ncbi:hypothetical protein PQQ51_31560 [Paraburkholderia xenovorans]|uniref:hypothetical protein n=1 Tax=Paraburkholderia xenovorans TaxID=36873 RepID=UPI0038B9D4F9